MSQHRRRLRSIKTTVLVTVSEAMEGMKKAGTITFQGPKGRRGPAPPRTGASLVEGLWKTDKG